MTSSIAALLLLALSAGAETPPAGLAPVATRDRKIVKRWTLPGDPRGLAFGADGSLYVGLAGPQAVIAVDLKSGTIRNRLVLDSPEIASTKELVTLRTDRARKRLFIANGSDESASILSLPDLAILREITMEGEAIRDAVPDPRDRHLYLLGRRVHVFDGEGGRKLRTLPVEDPMAIAVNASGSVLAVVAAEDFGNTKATVVALFDTTTFAEVTRDPLQTEQVIESAMFADKDRALVAFSRDHRFEMSLAAKPARTMAADGKSGAMRMTIGFGDLVNSGRVCLPANSGPQIATLTASDTALVYAEQRCSATGTFSGSTRNVSSASLYGIAAYALAWDPATRTLVVTDRAGFLTVYHAPEAGQ